MQHRIASPIILLVSRFITPYIMLYGFYVIFHGHYGPGGGFQGGAILAAAVLLIRIVNDPEVYEIHFKSSFGIPFGAAGVLIFFGIGFIAMVLGGNFLDYSYLPLVGLTQADVRSTGILLIEIGVAFAVMAILVSLYDNLLGEENV
jgi:multicomponent Na+:H+ antiporter subunit B